MLCARPEQGMVLDLRIHAMHLIPGRCQGGGEPELQPKNQTSAKHRVQALLCSSPAQKRNCRIRSWLWPRWKYRCLVAACPYSCADSVAILSAADSAARRQLPWPSCAADSTAALATSAADSAVSCCCCAPSLSNCKQQAFG